MSDAPLCMHLMHAELLDNSNYSYRFLPSSEEPFRSGESFASVIVCETVGVYLVSSLLCAFGFGVGRGEGVAPCRANRILSSRTPR